MGKKIDRELLVKYAKGNCTADELLRVKEFLLQPEWQQALEKLLEEDFAQFEVLPMEKETGRAWHTRFKERLESPARIRNNYRLWLGYAAALLVAAMSVLFFFYRPTLHQHTAQVAVQSVDTKPGSNKARLILADGSTVSLSDAAVGIVGGQDGLQIEKTADGEIVYQSDEQLASAASMYNTIETPRGGQYRITLPDGSKAWLNAGSSLTYPVRFAATERRVRMSGEVYFEITKVEQKDKKGRVPFFVETDGQEIQVLGTQFNVNAYRDEPGIRTTLKEGSVRVKSLPHGEVVTLVPGQQSILSGQLLVKQADVELNLGWTRGDFIFKGTDLSSVLRQLSRWYDMDVDCPPHLGQLRFSGIIAKSKPLSSVIKIMESTNDIHIKINERRLTVTD